MKRALALILAALFLMPSALAEIDLSGMSYDELLALHERITLEIWTRAETKAVTVPQGIWEVGKDIPAGTYTIKCADGDLNDIMKSYCNIKWYRENPMSGKKVYQAGSVIISNPKSKHFKESNVSEYTMDLYEGMFLEIDAYNNKAVFYPNTGKTNLGFDW